MKYKAYKMAKGLKFGTTRSGVPHRTWKLSKDNLQNKKSPMWDTGELYYDLEKIEDYMRSVFL